MVANKIKIDEERLMALRNEIDMSIAYNNNELKPILDECLSRYNGTYVPAFASDWDIVVNEVYPIIQSYLPSIFFRTPRAILKPKQKTYITKKRDPVSGKMVEVQLDSSKSASSQESILNYSVVEEMDYKTENRKTLLDSLIYPYGILWHGYKGDFGMTEEQDFLISDGKVFVSRISPMKFIYDPSVSISNINEAKWVGRIIDVPLIDLIEDDKLDVDKKLIQGYKGYGTKVGGKSATTGNRFSALETFNQMNGRDTSTPTKSLVDYADNDFNKSRMAKFVQLYEIFLRPTKKEAREGKKGYILLLTPEQSKPLRVNNWTIKAKGFPAKLLYFNDIPDVKTPMADIDTYKSIVDQKNVIFNLQLRNAQESSKIWVGIAENGADEDDILAVQRGDNSIIRFKDSDDVRRNMMVASPGGSASSELYIIDQRIQRNLEDKSGISDLRKGFLQSGEESATSVKIREAGGAVRIAFRQDLMADFLISSFKYINQLNRQFKTVEDAVRIIGTLDIDWQENITREELQAEVDVDINVFSMLPENPERELRKLNTILALTTNALTNSTIMKKISEEGKTMNLTPIIEQMLTRLKLKEPNIFRNIDPKESQGFVSAQQLNEARANVQAALQGKPPPKPPNPEDDHRVKLEVYGQTAALLKQMGQMSEILDQLISQQQLLMQQVKNKGVNPPQQIKLPKPTLETI